MSPPTFCPFRMCMCVFVLRFNSHLDTATGAKNKAIAPECVCGYCVESDGLNCEIDCLFTPQNTLEIMFLNIIVCGYNFNSVESL